MYGDLRLVAKVTVFLIFLKSKKMAPQVGLKPTTVRLTAECSTTELLRNKK